MQLFSSNEFARIRRVGALSVLLFGAAACFDDPITTADGEVLCNVDQTLFVSGGVPANGIAALTQPVLVDQQDAGAAYLIDSDRVLGVVQNGVARAYPHNILWRHEIINDTVGGDWLSVSFCPLTGSGLGFDPVLDGERLDLGVSGLLFANNLVMYDRITTRVYGPQLAVVSLCEGYLGQEMGLVAVYEMSWGRWKELYPNSKVVSSENRPNFNYRQYPYGSYDIVGDESLLFDMPVDRTRPIKERVLAVRIPNDSGRGFPFGELEQLGNTVAINETIGGVPTAIFYEADDGQAALAFDARVNGQTLTFDADTTNGVWIDQETGSTWRFDGTATAGQHVGERLEIRADAYTLFWFAWRHFQPNGSTFPN